MELRRVRTNAERIDDVMADDAGAADPAHERPFVVAEGAGVRLEVRDVWFRYAIDDPWILKGASMAIEPGESVAIVGPSGGGKTTLLKLMLGLLAPTDGKILAGGIDIQKLGIDRYRKLVGTVMQDDQLFAGSIADNISFFDPTPDQAAVERFARLAAVHDDIVAMPMAYNTMIGDMGAALSGGQKQRILLARALYKQPRILFLDEATSALDAASEALVTRAVEAMDMTRVLVAHRKETIAIADRVVALDPASRVNPRGRCG